MRVSSGQGAGGLGAPGGDGDLPSSAWGGPQPGTEIPRESWQFATETLGARTDTTARWRNRESGACQRVSDAGHLKDRENKQA
jgi:hypothetical protein